MDFKSKYRIYPGAATLEELLNTLEFLGMQKSKCFFIKFKEMYYAVFYGSSNSEMVIGSINSTAFYSNNGRLEEEYIEALPHSYPVNSRNNTKITYTLAYELNMLDPALKVMGYPSIKSNKLNDYTDDFRISKYTVLLALTFCSKFYPLNKLEGIEQYFNSHKELKRFLCCTKGAVSINPFKQLIEYEDHSVGAYAIRYYYNMYSHSVTPTFALIESNPYTENLRRRRKWLSISQYKSLYPDDFIDYPKPDFRTDKTTCKWCGNKLPPNRLSFCNDNCSHDFALATQSRRGELLGYKILCRDNFICQICHKDLATYNQFGIKIPVSKLSSTPDSDGEYRRIAEVHHLKSVASGGSDHQSNLITTCSDCHLLIEGKVKHK